MKYMQLPIPIANDEKLAMQERLAKEVLRAADMRAQEKMRHGEAQDRIKAVESDIDSIAKALRDGIDIRTVQVEDRFWYGRRVVETIRLDTGDTVNTRALTDEEMQIGIAFSVPDGSAPPEDAPPATDDAPQEGSGEEEERDEDPGDE